MKKLISLSIFLIFIFLLSGCTHNSADDPPYIFNERKIVCDQPYIISAGSCCLDENGNDLCDNDEIDSNSSRFLPSSCTITPSVSCEDFKVLDSGKTIYLNLYLRISNEPFNNVSINLNSPDTNINLCSLSCIKGCIDSDNLPANSLTTWKAINCENIGETGSKFKADVLFTYTTSSGISHTKMGVITTKVE